MKKTLLTAISIIALSFSIQSQNVYIPDANFKAALLANTEINTDSDKLEISVNEAIAFKGGINVSDMNIKSLIGIEAFTKIYYLYCSNNQLTTIDISKNITLNYLYCTTNQLTTLDISTNSKLIEVRCSENQLKSLDISKNIILYNIYCQDNFISTLDLTNNKKLTYLNCDRNQLTSINLTNNISLTSFYCYNNKLTSLDVSKNTALTEFYCTDNPNLNCIQALNTQDKTNWHKDEFANYSENCTTALEKIPIDITKTISNIYNLQGQAVNNDYIGLVIIKYTDGSTDKKIQ